MNIKMQLSRAAGGYHTREQLYALCVLLLWGSGLSLSNDASKAHTVTLNAVPNGNTGLSVYQLKTNPNATGLVFTEHDNVPYATIHFEVLGVPLEVQFDHAGEGTVTFAEEPMEAI